MTEVLLPLRGNLAIKAGRSRDNASVLCPLMKQLAIPLSNPKTIAKWLVMSPVI